MKIKYLPSMFLIPVTAEEVKCIVINNLKRKSNELNSLSLFVLIAIGDVLYPSIASLVNCSFASGIFPDLLKITKITPIFKSGNPKDVCNYRPVSVLPLFSKIYERCMYNRLSDFLTRHSVISDCQFGIKKKIWI